MVARAWERWEGNDDKASGSGFRADGHIRGKGYRTLYVSQNQQTQNLKKE